MPKYKAKITSRDWQVMKFLWKWKLVGTSALSAKFFDGLQPFTAYSRMYLLKRHGIVQQVPLPSLGGSAWALSPKGFAFLKARLPELSNKSLLSGHNDHDFLVSAIHLGEWLQKVPESVEVISEQQLKCIAPDLFPSWVPKVDMHRPDGYSRISGENGPAFLVALEVELSLKAPSRYIKVKDFYAYFEQVSAVFWIVNSRNSMKRIVEYLGTTSKPTQPKHNFFLLRDLQETGWGAKCQLGEFKGQPYREILSKIGITKAQQSPNTCYVKNLLDLRIKPKKIDTYRVPQKR